MRSVQIFYRLWFRNVNLRLLALLLPATFLLGLAVIASPAREATAQRLVDPPTGAIATEGRSSIEVSWDHADNVREYFLRWEEDGEVQTDPFKDYTVDDDARVRYTLRGEGVDITSIEVKFRQRNGEPNSDWAQAVVASDGVPDNLTVTRTGNQLAVTWEQDPLTQEREIDRYQLWYKTPSTLGSGTFQLARGTGSDTIELPANSHGNAYRVRIRAVYEGEYRSDFSQWVDVEAVESPPATQDSESTDSHPADPHATDSGPDGHAEEPTVPRVLPTGGTESLCTPGQTLFDNLDGPASGYDEARIPLESHVWFFPTRHNNPRGQSFGHAHLLSCVPFPISEGGEAVNSGTLDMDIQVQVHLADAVDLAGDPMLAASDDVRVIVREIEIRGLDQDGGGDVLVDRIFADEIEGCTGSEGALRTQAALQEACSFVNCTTDSPHGACIDSVELRGEHAVQLRNSDRLTGKPGLEHDGSKQLRVAAVHEVYVGTELVAEMRAIGRAPFDLDVAGNGSSDDRDANEFRNIFESSGWLIESSRDGAGGYATAGLRSQLIDPVAAGSTVNLDLRFEADPCSRLCAVEQMPLADYAVFLDPDFHGPGCTDELPDCRLFSSIDGDPAPTSPIHNVRDAEITIPADLEPGHHQLVIAVEQPMISGQQTSDRNDRVSGIYRVPTEWSSTLTGLLIVHFVVE